MDTVQVVEAVDQTPEGEMEASVPIWLVKYESTDGKTVSHQRRETKEQGRNHDGRRSFIRKNLKKPRTDPTRTPYENPQKKKRILNAPRQNPSMPFEKKAISGTEAEGPAINFILWKALSKDGRNHLEMNIPHLI